MLQRYIYPKIQSHLEKNPILLLLGSRGVKKYEMISSAIENQEELLHIDFSKKKPKYVSKSCKSNIELLYLIRENLACDISYQRLFQINSIIK